MSKYPLRLITYGFLLFIFLVLDTFTDLNHKIIMSVSIILTFLVLFTFIFKIDGFKGLKIAVIMFAFIGLPFFILYYLGILNSFSNPLGGVLLACFVTLCGF